MIIGIKSNGIMRIPLRHRVFMAVGFLSTWLQFVGEKDDMWLFDCALNPQVTMLEPKSRLHSLEPQPLISHGGKERRSRKAVSALLWCRRNMLLWREINGQKCVSVCRYGGGYLRSVNKKK